jgi:hypothetical protein
MSKQKTRPSMKFNFAFAQFVFAQSCRSGVAPGQLLARLFSQFDLESRTNAGGRSRVKMDQCAQKPMFRDGETRPGPHT